VATLQNLIDQTRDIMTPKVSGLYRITNKVTGGFYIGSSYNVRRRWQCQRSHLNRGYHRNRHLQAAWTQHGEAAFECRVLAVLEVADLKETETRMLQQCVGQADCYNIGRFSTAAMKGRSWTPSPQEIERRIFLARNRSPEYRARIANALRGKTLSAETRKKISDTKRAAAQAKREGL
jgi:group I intron endonuclease